MMLNRLCAVCGRTVQQGQRCECQKKRHKAYDREHRDKDKALFYHSKSWARLREQAKVRANGCDEYIRYITKTLTPGVIAHHIFPIDERPELRLRSDNIVFVSARTHEMIHAAYDKGGDDKLRMQAALRAVRSL